MSGVETFLNVLLVEDLEDDRYLFERALKRTGRPVNLSIANDGVEALDYFQNQGRFANSHLFPPPDLVFLDLKMPGRNGFDVLRWMNERSLLSATRVIVLSGSSEPQDVALARELGAVDYLVKPITAERLQQIFGI